MPERMRCEMEQGQFQIYTGDGKGKTTAAIGLAVRAAGAGLRVYIGQFIKDMEYSEVSVLRKAGIVVELYGTGKGCLIGKNPTQEDRDAADRGMRRAGEILCSQRYDLVICDEINVAFQLHLLTEEQLMGLVQKKPASVELVFTGRGCPQKVLEQADLVTEMREIKHYCRTKGLLARKGIES